MKKILYLLPRFITAGAEQMVLQYATYFKENGYEVAVASVIGGGELTEKFKSVGIEVFVGKSRGLINFYRNYKEIKQKFQPDIIHSHVFSADVMAFLLSRKSKTRWISTQHNVEFAASVLRRFIWKFILRRADKIIAVSDNVYNYDLKEFKINPDKLLLVRNGVDLTKWGSVSEKVVDSILQIATVGRLEKQKGHEYLIQALGKLKDKNWQWHIYGAGSLDKKLKCLVKKQGIGEKVVWHGVVADMASEFKNIDVLVQPSLWEGLSIVAMEAMAAGRVVVGTAPVAEKLIENKVNGLIVENGSVDSLASVLSYCLDNRAGLSNLAKKARETAVANCDMTENIKKVQAVYAENI